MNCYLDNMTLYNRIQFNLMGLSPAMKKIADYFLSHYDNLPFESAESIADAVGVSSISVGRYLRQLGFQNMDELRLDLKTQLQTGWQITDRLAAQVQRTPNHLSQDVSLLRDIQHLQQTHSMRGQDAYQNMLKNLLQADAIYMIGLQSCRGLMLYFYSLLEYMRPNVHYCDGNSGAFIDAFNHGNLKAYMLVADIRHYAVHTQRLCHASEQQNMAYGLITDVYCPWASQLSGDVLTVETDVQQFWDSTTSVLALLQYLLNDMAQVLGNSLQTRIQKNQQLQDFFQQFEK